MDKSYWNNFYEVSSAKKSGGGQGHSDPRKITPLHRDPKQQELRIHLRTRFGLGPYKDSFWPRTLKVFKKRWFYGLGPKKY